MFLEEGEDRKLIRVRSDFLGDRESGRLVGSGSLTITTQHSGTEERF